MWERLKEALRKKPDPLGDIWKSRCQDQKRIEAQITVSSERHEGFRRIQQEGLQLIKEIVDIQGEEAIASLLENAALKNLSIVTQLKVLFHTRSESPLLIANALNSIPEEERKDWKYPRSPQNEPYRNVLEGILEQKEEEDYKKIKEKVEELGPIKSYKWEGILILCLQKGSEFMLGVLDIIPPEQIAPDKLDLRLALEKKLQRDPEQSVEREIVFSGVVQGIGFRGHCQGCSQEWGTTTGWARNERNGTVTLVLQGEPSRLDLIIEELEKPESRQAQLINENPLEKAEEILEEFKIRFAKGAVSVAGL